MASRIYYADNEDSSKEESISKYENIFEEYLSKCPTLTEALDQMFISSGATEEKSKELIKEIFSQINEHLTDEQLLKIKKVYPEMELETAQIISSYTCELSSDFSFNIYRILNNNLVSDNRNQGVKKISKYLFIFLKSLRKLKRYYPESGAELYRFISAKANLYPDPFNDKVIPYLKGNTKTFWGFTSTSENISMTYNFLGSQKEIKSGTIFTLTGDVWGYDITLFNVFGEKEILLEPERKIYLINSYPPINEIIQVRCEVKNTPLILENIIGNCEKQKNDNNNNEIDDDMLTIIYKVPYKILKEYNISWQYMNEFNECNPKIKDNNNIPSNEKKIKIFGQKFVYNNKTNCEIIYDGKYYDLEIYFDVDKYCKNLNVDTIEIKLTGISKIKDISGIFAGCKTLVSIPNISKLNTSNITDMSSMFEYCKIPFLLDISEWNTSNVINMSKMFFNCEVSSAFPDISKWNTSNVKDMSYMFSVLKIQTSFPDISKWNISSVANMSFMFSGISLSSLPDISKWDISNVTNISGIFSSTKISTYPDITKWNTSNVTNMSDLFSGCESLTSLPDISNWNTSNVTDMSSMFINCKSLLSLPDISKWNTSNVIKMNQMFTFCQKLTSLPDISKWDTSKVINMDSMFFFCQSLSSLPNISKWNISNVKTKTSMFYGCNKTLEIPSKFENNL